MKLIKAAVVCIYYFCFILKSRLVAILQYVIKYREICSQWLIDMTFYYTYIATEEMVAE